MSNQRRVVITGLGVAGPLGVGITEMWDSLTAGRCAIQTIQAFDASTLPSSVGGEVPAFKTTDFVPKNYRKSTKLMSRDIELAVVAAFEAARDANLSTPCMLDREVVNGQPIDPTRFGVNIGAGLICPDLNELAAAFSTATGEDGLLDLKRWGRDGMNNLTPLWLLKFLPNMLACHVSIVHDAQAISNTITCGEASGHLAIGEAFRAMSAGLMDVCLCGGAECKTNPMGLARAALSGRLVTGMNDQPASACRPFSSARSGMVCAEGGGLVVLESLEHARSRGARIYAELIGFGAAGNTYSWTEPDPSGAGVSMAVAAALHDAGLHAADVDFVGAFGCGTREHDAAELAGWRSVLGNHANHLPAMAIKGAVGTCGAGSGALDFCANVMALHNNTIPPSINTEPLDPACTFRFAQGDPVDHRILTAVSVGYALVGGQSGALVIRRFEESAS